MKRIFRTNFLPRAIGVLVLSTYMLYSCSQSEEVTPNTNNNNQQTTADAAGDEGPNFELVALDGSTFKMSNQGDKVVVLFFFGNSCPTCRAAGPDLEKKLNEAFIDETDYVIIGLDQWDGTKTSVESFKKITGISFPLLLKASSVANSYSTTYDRLIVVDKKGKIVHKGARAAKSDISSVVTVVTDLLDDM